MNQFNNGRREPPISYSMRIFIIGTCCLIATGLLLASVKDLSNSVADLDLPISNVSGAVVPHHNIVARKRAEFFSVLAKKINPPETIILISTNHFYAGQGRIQTTSQDWHLQQGEIKADQEAISFLIKSGLVANEPSSFKNEHGIYNILGDIKTNFPSAALVPIIIKDARQEQLSQLAQALEKSCADCLMIASVDFSHYQPALLAQLHDDKSIRDLQGLNTQDLLNGAEVDSGPSLSLLAMWAKDHQTEHFNLIEHTNSGIIQQNTDAESTSHIFGWYEKGDIVELEKSVSFIIGGDMMFARKIHNDFSAGFNKAVEQLGDRVFWGTDAAIVNLEGAITNRPIKNDIRADNFAFKFLPSVAKTFSYLRINAVSLANNHSNNAGQEGIDITNKILSAARIQVFGGYTDADASKVAQFDGQDLKLTMIGINLTYPDSRAESVIPLIKQYKKDPLAKVIIMPHWGIEYFAKHTAEQEKVARAWIDAGADLIVGGHPHVIADAEVYKGVPIIYSLGNLLFDQAFSKEVQRGLLIAGKFTENGLMFFGLPTQSIKYQPRLLTGYRKQEILNTLYASLKDYLVQTSAGIVIQLAR